MTTPTYKIVQNDDLSLVVSSDNEKLLETTYKRWEFMMKNCKSFNPNAIMDKHDFKTPRFLIISMGEINKLDVGKKYIYQFKAYTVEVPNDKSIFDTLTGIATTYKETK
jgi:hypothetical protein|nr:MAG TPA: hypothetical protein [Caudoviricetes sp.]